MKNRKYKYLICSLLSLFLAAACSQGGSGDSSSLVTSAGQGFLGYAGPVADFKLSCEEARFVVLLNLYRQQNGLNTLAVSKNGVLSVRWHGQDMINKNYFAHTEPNGRAFYDRAASFGYAASSENIAAGNQGAQGTFCQWKNSPGHNSNMLAVSHRTIGLGLSLGGGYGAYWANLFGPDANDTLSSPLSSELNCDPPLQLPVCN